MPNITDGHIRRNATEDVDARVAPVAVDVTIARERLQLRPIAALEERAPRGAAVPLHRAVIEVGEQLGNPRVQRGEREEGLMPEPGENPAFSDLDGDDLAPVAGSTNDGRCPASSTNVFSPAVCTWRIEVRCCASQRR